MSFCNTTSQTHSLSCSSLYSKFNSHQPSPSYLHQLLTPYVPTRLLRSSDKHLFDVPSIKLVQSRRSFLHAAPTVWNSLPLTLRSTSHFLFHSSLKTHLFPP